MRPTNSKKYSATFYLLLCSVGALLINCLTLIYSDQKYQDLSRMHDEISTHRDEVVSMHEEMMVLRDEAVSLKAALESER